MENYGYEQAISSIFLVLRFEMHVSQIQGCVVEQRVEKKRKIAESVWVHNVVTGQHCLSIMVSAPSQHLTSLCTKTMDK